eukprot:2953107-Amphidinium_carterae.2
MSQSDHKHRSITLLKLVPAWRMTSAIQCSRNGCSKRLICQNHIYKIILDGFSKLCWCACRLLVGIVRMGLCVCHYCT